MLRGLPLVRHATSRPVVSHSRSHSSLSSSHLRTSFLDFFSSHSHPVLPSASLVPRGDDHSLHFTNAGMNQWKGVFLGQDPPPEALRAANSQKCVRVNDLRAVGLDGSHHTFFEMLGSWSFGDYFKADACKWAWSLLTQEYGLDVNKLSVTYFGGCKELGLGPDEETRQLWLQLGVPSDRVLPFGVEHNFWSMGRTGPCGPCTEIHYDFDGAPGRANQGNGRCVELWNLVFMEYNKLEDGSLVPLPRKHVDTGMGLERLTAVVNGTESNYDTDLFLPLFDTIQTVTGCPAYTRTFTGKKDLDHSYRVLADHMRMVTACVTDDIYPDSSYRLKRVVRRSLRTARDVFGADEKLLGELALTVNQVLSPHYPEMERNLDRLDAVLEFEAELLKVQEESGKKAYVQLCKEFPAMEGVDVTDAELYHNAMKMIRKEKFVGDNKVLGGKEAVIISDSIGLDSEMISILAKRNHFVFSEPEFDLAWDKKKAASKSNLTVENISSLPDTDDSFKYSVSHTAPGRYQLPQMKAKILKLYDTTGNEVETLVQGSSGSVHLNQTTFYSESGGQVSDVGLLEANPNSRFEVKDCQQVGQKKKKISHLGKVLEGSISVGDVVSAKIDPGRRIALMQNHSGLHLFHSAINDRLPLTAQRGSKVTPKNFRLDLLVFNSKIDLELVSDLESAVCHLIEEKLPLERREMDRKNLKYMENVTTVPGAHYPDRVTVISVPGGQTEPCCGTHMANTGDVQALTVLDVKHLSPGARSFLCATGQQASSAQDNGMKMLQRVQRINESVQQIGEDTPQSDLAANLSAIKACIKSLGEVEKTPLPYVIRQEMTTILTELQRHIRTLDRASNKESLQEEVGQAVFSAGDDAPFVLHSCTNLATKVELSKLTKVCKDKPILIICELNKELVARAVVPISECSDAFNAHTWLSTVQEAMDGGVVKAPHLKDARLEVNFRLEMRLLKAEQELQLGNLVAKALQSADEFARENMKKK